MGARRLILRKGHVVKYLRSAQILSFVAAVVAAIYAYDVKEGGWTLAICLVFVSVGLVLEIVIIEQTNEADRIYVATLGKPMRQFEILKAAYNLPEGQTLEVYTKTYYTSQKELALIVAHFYCTLELVRNVPDVEKNGRLYRLYKQTSKERRSTETILATTK